MAACQLKDYAQIALARERLNDLSKPLVAEIEDACFGNGITRHLDGTFGSLRMVEPTGP
jgi:hypothetical protein